MDDKKSEWKWLFGNLEFPGFDDLSFLISQLIDINALVVRGEVNRGFRSHVFSFINLLAKEIERQNVTIVTNNVPLAAAVSPDRNVYLLGGRYQNDTQITIGPLFLSGVQISVDSAIISVGGISIRELGPLP